MARRGTGPIEVIPLEAEIDRLYQGSPDEFTAARNALAARLKAAGRRDDAERVRTLAKPALPAWAVNQVYWHARDVFDRLLRAGDRLREAQLASLKGASAEVAQAALARQQAIDAVVDRAMRFVTEAGSPASGTTQQRIAVTADALAAYGSLPNRPPAGRLTGDLDPPGFGLLASLVPAGALGQPGTRDLGPTGGLPPSRDAPRRGKEEHRGTGAQSATGAPGPGGVGTASRATRTSEAEPERARRDEARERREALERARFESARADAELRRRRAEQDRAARELERAAARLASAESAEQRARETLDAAQRARAEAAQSAQQMRAQLDVAREAAATAEREAAEAKRRLEEAK